MVSTNEHSPLLQLPRHHGDNDEMTKESSDSSKAVAVEELRDLLQLAYPVILTTFMEFFPGFISIALTGHLNSPYTKEYVDAATLSTMFTNISGYSIGFGLSSALDTLCSQAYGAKRYDKIGVYVQSGLIVIGVCLLPITLVNYYSEPFLLYLGQDPTVSAFSQIFSRYNLIGVPFVFVYELIRKALQAQGIMTPLVVIMIIGNIVNVVSGYIFAYHTSMEFAGIALSRSLGNIVLPFLLWGYFWMRPEHLTQWWSGWDLRAALEHVGVFLRLGVPGMLMLVMEWWAFEILSLMAGVLPNSIVAVSAHAVQLNTVSMMYMAFLGFSVAANMRVGIHLGANQPAKARLVGVLAMKIVAALSVGIALVVFFGRHAIPYLFVNDQVAIASAANVLTAWAPFELAEGLNCVTQGVFRGAGMQDRAVRTNAIAYYAMGIPLAYVLAFHLKWGVEGLWIGFGVGITISCGALFSMFRHWNWKNLARDAQRRTAE